nr:reverse transcriptase domain-containing protein [Tanacetum cinerariifolium]
MTGNLEPRRGRSDSPRKKDSKRRTVFKRLEKGVFHRLGDKGKSMSAYSNDSRRRSYHSIHEDTESCYQSSRSRETEFASEKRHNKRASSRRMEPLSGTFLRGEVAASSRERKKSLPSWKQQEARQKQNFKNGGFQNQQRSERKQGRQIEKMLKAGKLSHLIKELKKNNGKDQTKAAKKGETLGKDKPLAIVIVQPWQRIAKQRITQTFSSESVISFPPLGEEDGTEGPMIIEAKMGGHFVHHMHVDMGSSSEILFGGEVIWPLGQLSLLVKIGDEEHSTSAWLNFMVVRSPSPYNGIIGRPGVRRIQAVSSTTHGMLKFLVTGETITLPSSRIIPLECATVSGPRAQ